MNEGHRSLEQKALRNVRALFERLEHDDLRRRRRQKYLLLAAMIPIILVLVLVVSLRPEAPQGTKQSQSCEIDAWNARAAEFERRARQANPDMPYREIQKQLERERPLLTAEARVECSSKGKS